MMAHLIIPKHLCQAIPGELGWHFPLDGELEKWLDENTKGYDLYRDILFRPLGRFGACMIEDVVRIGGLTDEEEILLRVTWDV